MTTPKTVTDMTPAEIIARAEAARTGQMFLVIDAPGNRISRIVFTEREAYDIINAMPDLPPYALALPLRTINRRH